MAVHVALHWSFAKEVWIQFQGSYLRSANSEAGRIYSDNQQMVVAHSPWLAGCSKEVRDHAFGVRVLAYLEREREKNVFKLYFMKVASLVKAI
jgi:hypothetical protein